MRADWVSWCKWINVFVYRQRSFTVCARTLLLTHICGCSAFPPTRFFLVIIFYFGKWYGNDDKKTVPCFKHWNRGSWYVFVVERRCYVFYINTVWRILWQCVADVNTKRFLYIYIKCVQVIFKMVSENARHITATEPSSFNLFFKLADWWIFWKDMPKQTVTKFIRLGNWSIRNELSYK